MATLAAVANALHTLGQLDAQAATPPETDHQLVAPEPGEIQPRQGIGLNKPLTVVLERVYPGAYPDTLRWLPGDQSGDILVTSAHKSFAQFEAAPRAVHMLKKSPPRQQMMAPVATEQGSPVAFYSPAVTDESILFTFEMSVDRDFSKEVGDKLAAAFTAAGALPVFAPAAPYLVGAGIAIPIGEKALNLLARPNVFFSQTLEISLARPGMRKFQPGAFVLVPDNEEQAVAGCTLDENMRLVGSDGSPYAGEVPYVVVSLDGTENDDLKSWSEHAASAAVVERFFGGGETLTAAIDVVTDSLSLYNDMRYQREALSVKEQLDAATDPGLKAKLQDKYDALKKNVQNDAIRSTLT